MTHMTRQTLSQWITETNASTIAGGKLPPPGVEADPAEWAEWWKNATPHERRCAQLRADPTIRPHGQMTTYMNWGCRCEPCTEAQATRKRRSRKRKATEDFKDPAAPDISKPYDSMTRLEKVIYAVNTLGIEKVTQQVRDEYEAWKADQEDVI